MACSGRRPRRPPLERHPAALCSLPRSAFGETRECRRLCRGTGTSHEAKVKVKVVLLFAFVAFASAGCNAQKDATQPAELMGGSLPGSADAKRYVENIEVPQLELCVLDAGAIPPSKLGGASPACNARVSFTPSAIEPERIDGDLGVILRLTPADQDKLSDISGSFVKRYVVLLKGGTVVSISLLLGGRVTELHISFPTEADSDLFFRTLFAR